MKSSGWIALLALCGSASCGQSATARTWPAGTVLVVGDQEITATEVDEFAPTMALLEPRSADKQLRRLALTNVVLPRSLARAMAKPGARDRALRDAQAALEQVRTNRWVGPPEAESTGGTVIDGSFATIGIVKWMHALELQPGEWSPIFEEIGCFTAVRRLDRTDGAQVLETRFKLEVLCFPYLPLEHGAAQIQNAYDQFHLDIVDPDWRAIVPELLQYRMGVHSS